MLALFNFVPVAAKWLAFLDFERVAASLRRFSTCAWPDRNSLALPDLHLVSIVKNRYHFLTCACHSCAGATLTFSVSFQILTDDPRNESKGFNTSLRARRPVSDMDSASKHHHCSKAPVIVSKEIRLMGLRTHQPPYLTFSCVTLNLIILASLG